MSQMPGRPFGFVSPQSLDYQSKEQELTVGQFFNAVYAWMAAGLALTAVVAYAVYSTQNRAILNTGTFFVVFIVQIGLVIAINSAINRISATVACLLFLLFSALMGVSMSSIFFTYHGHDIAVTFLITAGTFGATSLYGYVTKRDLTRLGSLLFMALIGLVIASLVNMFARSSGLYWIISYAGVLIFVGLTAFDTQRLKYYAMQNTNNPAMAHRIAIVGSLQLYLDFINLFLFLLQIMGNRRQ
jgi:uncharacterized protein